MFSTIALRYSLISAAFFIVNFVRLIKCFVYRSVYNNNFKNGTPNNNYIIRHSVISLLNKANTSLQNPSTDIIASKIFIDDFNSAFFNAAGYFLHNMLHSVVWPLIIIKKFIIFIPAAKISNQLFSLAIALIEGFAVYLLGLFLDTTGIGSRILTYLLDVATALFEHFSA